MAGLSTYAELTRHGTPAMNVSNILSQGFKPGNLSWAGANKIFSSSSPNLISKYGDAAIDLVTPRGFWESRLPFGGGISKEGIGFGSERASSVAQANKGMRFARRLRAGAYPNSALAQKLLQAGTTYPSLWSRFLPWFARTAMSAPAAGLTTLFQSTPANAGEQKFMDAINEQQGVMAAGQQTLGQTQPQIAAQQAAAAHTQRGNYQAPTMTYEEIKKEADKTGGTRHAGEMTKAAGQGGGGQGGGGGGQSSRPRNSPSSQQSSYSNVRRYGRADGGMVSIMDLLNRRI